MLRIVRAIVGSAIGALREDARSALPRAWEAPRRSVARPGQHESLAVRRPAGEVHRERARYGGRRLRLGRTRRQAEMRWGRPSAAARRSLRPSWRNFTATPPSRLAAGRAPSASDGRSRAEQRPSLLGLSRCLPRRFLPDGADDAVAAPGRSLGRIQAYRSPYAFKKSSLSEERRPSKLGNNLGTLAPKYREKRGSRADQKAGRINKIDVPALSAKPPSPVQIRAAPTCGRCAFQPSRHL